ncbi:hypothetical protein CFB43_25115 [Burkholderia sp. AU15512]|nr:hypothetical protein CFB43_25115 [Burkholderia sp. AU15512]
MKLGVAKAKPQSHVRTQLRSFVGSEFLGDGRLLLIEFYGAASIVQRLPIICNGEVCGIERNL